MRNAAGDLMSQPVLEIAQSLMSVEERDAVDRVLMSGHLVQGAEVEAFERDLGDDLAETRYAVALASGTAALELSLSALGLGPGDEVVTTPFTFVATVSAVLKTGASVRFADIGLDLNLDPAAAAAALTERTKLVLPVHLYGIPADVDAMSGLGVPILEDAAQAHLASLRGRRVGRLGLAACFSFYASKNMTTGEGGALTTDDEGLADRVRVLRNQGMRGDHHYVVVGSNARMTDVSAAIGRVQLRRLPAWTARRRMTAELYLEALREVEGVNLPIVPEGAEPAWHLFTIRLDPGIDRDSVLATLNADGIRARVYYPQIVADAGPYREHPRIDASLPLDGARAAARTVVSLPVHPGIGKSEVERVAASLERAIARAREGSR
jgi:perosamine synthetase